jgi:hypothetical protein
MSDYGTDRTFKSKKAFREFVAAEGAENVGVFDTSMFPKNDGSKPATTVAELRPNRDMVVGPDVYSDRRWYATVKVGRDGKVVVK